MKIRIKISQFFCNTEKLVDFIQFPLFKTTMKYCVSAGIFMKKQRSLVEYKSIQSEGWKETVTFNSRTPLNLRYKGELSWS